MPYLEVRSRLRERMFAALARDTDLPRFERELPFYYDLLTFRGAAGRTELVAALAVPGERLEASRAEGKTRYTLGMRLIVLDTATGRIARRDTVESFQADAPLKPGDYLRAHLSLEVSPSDSALYRVAVEVPGSPTGQLYGGPLAVPDYSGDRLMLSDLVLAEADREGAWRRGDVSLAMVPPGQFPSSGAFRLFYEIYNLPAGVPYRTEIQVRPAGRDGLLSPLRALLGGKRGVQLGFEGVATSAAPNTLQEVRRVAAQLHPGGYRLQLRITNLVTGQTAVRDRLFGVVP
ncbi:MAG: hypothetical protein HY703_11485 [Gemmatimonadetes bacterium]|nr:hypothetical protein [Gemmatimonadota bacterium]